MKINLTNAEAVFTAGAIKASIERMEKFCAETDELNGSLNDIYRDHIRVLKGAYLAFENCCTAEGIELR